MTVGAFGEYRARYVKRVEVPVSSFQVRVVVYSDTTSATWVFDKTLHPTRRGIPSIFKTSWPKRSSTSPTPADLASIVAVVAFEDGAQHMGLFNPVHEQKRELLNTS